MKIIVGSYVTVTWPETQACHSGRVTEVVGDSVFVAFKGIVDDDNQFIRQDDTWFDASESPLTVVELVLDVI